jgi:hypothetical protein
MASGTSPRFRIFSTAGRSRRTDWRRRLRNAYTFLISGLTEIAQRYLDRPIPILLHGYDYPVPDGRGFMGGWGILPGPWLQPGLFQKGHQNLNANKAILKMLIDGFNTMLKAVSSLSQFGHVTFVGVVASSRGSNARGAQPEGRSRALRARPDAGA